ncbi:lipid II:glycine glycyltransferase FemX [Pseudonocardia acaciae]|uniref:lipid II:glycine glycyltransferase FemX n=1 Tax=Pseudonocardia acaciae TaxID=551276 RepID=UPI00048BBA0D|nr:GNAT family N-acetyltransferase [Pseudonocardia acaciae]
MNAQLTISRLFVPGHLAVRDWDRLVANTPGADVTQLSAWAAIRAEAGYSPIYLLAYLDDELAGGALVLCRRVLGLLDVGYLPYGPVIATSPVAGSGRAAVTTALADELAILAGTLRMLFVQPPEHAHDVSSGLLARGFRVSHAGIAPAGSYRLDLRRPLEEIRSGFSRRLKSWTNRWDAHGVRVRLGDERDLPLLLALMRCSGERQGFAPPPRSYVRTLYRELAAGGHVALFIGEVRGVPVSADLVTVCAGMVRGRLGGFDASGEAGKLSVPAAVRWEIIKWARARGCRWLDFGGLPERMLSDMIDHGIHSSDEWPSAQRSKLQFNGTAFRYPTPVELIRPGVVRTTYDLVTANPAGHRLITTARSLLRGTRTRPHAYPIPRPRQGG